MANVNRPTDFAQKEKDINTKLQLYGIYSAFAEGKVPSNKQIDIALNSFLASRAISSPSKNLSEEGRDLVRDVKGFVNEAKKMLLSKNDGNLIQEFIWDAQDISGANAQLPGAPVDKATAQQHGDQALDGLKTLGRLIISNGQFRKLLDDALVLARDVAGDAATKTASKINPDEDKLKQIDEPAEDNTWHDTPDMNTDSLKSRAQDTFNRNKPFSKDDAEQAARDGQQQAQQHPGDSKQSGIAGAKQTLSNLKSQAQKNIPDEHQERAQNVKEETKERSREYIDKKMPKERREQVVYRLKKMVVEIQGHSDYQQAIETLLDLAERYAGHGKELGQQSTGTVKSAHNDSSLTRAETNLKTLIERFANFTSLDDLTESLNQIYRDADKDPELKNWFHKINVYIRKCLREQGYILKDSSSKEWDNLYDQGQFLFRDRYRDHTDHIFDEAKFIADQFEQDPQNQAFASAGEKLFLDLGRDENGKPAFKPHLLKDLTEVIIPAIFANTRYVPIPRIEVSDPMADVIVENLVLESDNLFPNSLEFSSDNHWRFGRKTVRSARENKIMIAGSGIQLDLRDVAYYIKKKQGFPSITDKGVMDIMLQGEGFSFKVAARNAHKTTDRTHFISIDKVDVTINSLAIKIKQSNHKLLFTIAKSLLLKVMKPVIQKVIEKQIKDNIEKADAMAYSVYKEVEKSKEYAKRHPEEAGNIYQQYVNAVQTKMNEKKKKAEKVASKTDVNVAITKEDSMFKHISLPGGISTKATEYKDLARKGDRWESPIFGLGSAKASTDIPRAQKVTRKPHSTRSGGIRGGNHPNSSSNSGSKTGDLTGRSGTGYSSSDTGYNQSSNLTDRSAAGYGQTGTSSDISSGLGQTAGYGMAGTGSGLSSGLGQTAGYGQADTGLARSSGLGQSGTFGQSTGTGVPQTSATAYGSTSGTSGLNAEMDQAFRSAGTGSSGLAPSGTGAPGAAGQTTFYDSATRQL